jgi:glutathione S-transferase
MGAGRIDTPSGEAFRFPPSLSIELRAVRLRRREHEETPMINCYVFGSVPPFAQGLVRDLRARWALEEAGLPYRVTLVGEGANQVSRAEYRKVQPFGQVPALEDGDLTLFESGAIVQYVAEKSGALLPARGPERALVIQWMFAALNTMELPIQNLAAIDLFYASERWAKERRPGAVEAVRTRLAELAACLGPREHLIGRFSGADILMTTVLRILRHTELLDEQPALVAYKERCEARPAFEKALGGQMAAFRD